MMASSRDERRDPRGGTYYWIGGQPTSTTSGPDSDLAAVLEGFAALTPLKLDLTDDRTLELISLWPLLADARASG